MENLPVSPDKNPLNVDNFNGEKLNSVDRLEAFSDGVFGVAITLLVLNIRVPLAQDIAGLKPPNTLAHGLLAQWPTYVGYVISFFTIGIVWANHHITFTYITHANRTLRMLNLFLLMTVTLIPFSTQLLSTYIQQPADGNTASAADSATTAAFVYAFGWILLSIAYGLVWRYAMRGKLVDERLTPSMLNAITRRTTFGLFWYVVAAIGALFNPFLGVLICLLLAIYYMVL